MYLVSRGKLFWFSRKLPQHEDRIVALASGARRVGTNGYLRFSLETGNRREAERLARRYAVEVDDALEELEERRRNAQEPISTEDIEYAAKVMKSSLLSADEAMHKEAVSALLSGRPVQRRPDRETGILDELPPPGGQGDAELLKQLRAIIPFYLYTQLGKVPEGPVTSDYLPFVTAFREVAESLKRRAKGQAVPSPAPPAEKPKAQKGPSWDKILAYYEEQHSHLGPDSRTLYRLAIKRLAEHAKVSPKELTRAQVIAWRDGLKPGGLAPRTAQKNLTAAGTVYRFALNNEKLGNRNDPFQAVTIPGAKSSESSRAEYSLESLARIFADPPQLSEIPEAAGAHAAYWVPIIALYTGARREEICGLLTSEVVVEGHNVTILLRKNTVRGMKNKNSVRKVPLHRHIVELGFIDYVEAVREAGAERLFPGLVHSNSFAKWFIRHVEARLGAQDFKQDVHSFRHTFKTAARDADIQEEMSDSITGHAPLTVARKYGSPAGQNTLRQALNRVNFRGVVISRPPEATKAQIVELMRSADRRRRHGQLCILRREHKKRAAARLARRDKRARGAASRE